jgi:hypothetical protein
VGALPALRPFSSASLWRMIVGVQAIPTAAAIPAASILRRAASRLRARQALGRGLRSGLRTGLVLAVLGIPAAVLVDAWTGPILLFVAATASAVTLLTACVHWCTWGRRWLTAEELAELPGWDLVRDEWATWLEWQRGGPSRAPAFLPWLEDDVARRLAVVLPAAQQRVSRPRLGRFVWLVPLVLLLLILMWLAAWLAPPWPGLLGGAGGGAGSGGAGAGGAAGGAAAGSGEDTPPAAGDDARVEDRSPPRAAPPQPAPKDPPPEDGEPPKPEQPAPLLDLPEQRRFVVPEFIGDGPTRRARVRAAEVPDDGPGARPAAQAGEAPPAAVPPPRRAEFERAAEAALRARHVPPAERAIVRRFFERLREAGQ